MGRPLRQDTIEAMGLQASGYTLSKQVGYNKYRTLENNDKIVRLSDVENLENDDVVLILHDNYNDYPVLKITKHFFQTENEAYVYTLDDNGVIHFEKPGVSVNFDPTPTITVSALYNGSLVMEPEGSENITLTYNGSIYTGNGSASIDVKAGDSIDYVINATDFNIVEGSTSSKIDVELTKKQVTLTFVAKIDDEEVEGALYSINGGEPSESSTFTGDIHSAVECVVTYTDAEEHNYSGSVSIADAVETSSIDVALTLVEEPVEEPVGE